MDQAEVEHSFIHNPGTSSPEMAGDTSFAKDTGQGGASASGSVNQREGQILPSAQEILALSEKELEEVFGSTIQSLKRKERKQNHQEALKKKKLLLAQRRQHLRAVEDGWNNPINAKLGEISRKPVQVSLEVWTALTC